MRWVGWLAAAALLSLGGCVAYSPEVDRQASPKPGMAYLAGIFRDESAKGQRKLGISYEHVETATTHTFEFQKDGKAELQVIEVPAGTYRVRDWFMASGLTNEVMVRGKPQGALFTRQFKVAPDQVHYLGEYVGSGTVTPAGTIVYYNANMRPLRILPAPRDERALAERFPNFGKLPLKAAYL